MAHSAVVYRDKTIFIKDGALNEFVMAMACFILKQSENRNVNDIRTVSECRKWVEDQEGMPPGLKDVELDDLLTGSENISRFLYCLDQMLEFISTEQMFDFNVVKNVVDRIKTELLS